MKDAGGLFLHVISGSAFLGSVGQSNYAASKAGMLGLMYAWSTELQRYNIRTNALWPVAQTDMTAGVLSRLMAPDGLDRSAEDLGFGRPEEIAKAVVYLCSDAAAPLRNQIVLFNGRKLATFTHIHESASEVADCWSVAGIGRALAGSAEQNATALNIVNAAGGMVANGLNIAHSTNMNTMPTLNQVNNISQVH